MIDDLLALFETYIIYHSSNSKAKKNIPIQYHSKIAYQIIIAMNPLSFCDSLNNCN